MQIIVSILFNKLDLNHKKVLKLNKKTANKGCFI